MAANPTHGGHYFCCCKESLQEGHPLCPSWQITATWSKYSTQIYMWKSLWSLKSMSRMPSFSLLIYLLYISFAGANHNAVAELQIYQLHMHIHINKWKYANTQACLCSCALPGWYMVPFTKPAYTITPIHAHVLGEVGIWHILPTLLPQAWMSILFTLWSLFGTYYWQVGLSNTHHCVLDLIYWLLWSTSHFGFLSFPFFSFNIQEAWNKFNSEER